MLYVCHSNSLVYREVYLTISAGLTANGIEHQEIRTFDIKSISTSPEDIYLVLGTAGNVGAQLQANPLPGRVHLLFFERLPLVTNDKEFHAARFLNDLIKYHKQFSSIYVCCQSYVNILKTRAIESKLFHFGYSEFMNDCKGLKLAPPLKNIIFCGTIKKGRRSQILKTLSQKADQKIEICSAWAHNRAAIIQNSKICVNVHFTPSSILETLRAYYVMANKCLFLTETVSSSAPFVTGEHLVSCEAGRLGEYASYYLEHDKERQAIIDKAYTFVTNDLHISKTIVPLIAAMGGIK